jgi:hypothetical protein
VANNLIDLDAAKREAGGKPITIKLGGKRFELPAELPVGVLSPLFGEALADLVSILASAMATIGDDKEAEADAGQSFSEQLFGALTDNPDLPMAVINAIRECLARLFGEQQWQEFVDLGASVQDFMRLVGPLAAAYGAGLGEVLGSLSSSTKGGRTSKPTAQRAVSTRAASGRSRARRAS